MSEGGVLITGGAGGIGTAIAKQLRQRGHFVVVADVHPPTEADFFVEADLCRTDRATEVINRASEATKAHGGLSALVACAGRYDGACFESSSLDAFRSVMAINVESPLALIKAWHAKNPPDNPRVVLVSSAAASVGSRDPAYSASKAGREIER